MFTGFSSKGMGLVTFTLLYVVYVIGYTTTNMTAQTIPAIMTNDPRQRPTLGVRTTAFNYLVPMVMSMVLNVVLLPKCGGTYNQAFRPLPAMSPRLLPPSAPCWSASAFPPSTNPKPLSAPRKPNR